jgi:Na+-transporting NADH:ubiquinone oxidoreductase subunit E
MEAINLIIRSIFIENMIFAYFLGMCAVLAVSKDLKASIGLGIATLFVIVITVVINYFAVTYVLAEGALSWLGEDFASVNLSVFSLHIFVAVTASFVQVVEMIVEKHAPRLYNQLGIFLPLMAVNCAVVAGSLFMEQREFANFGIAAAYAFGSGIGWLLAIVIMASIREKLQYSHVPRPLKGLGITFIITALLGIGFMSFSGISI